MYSPALVAVAEQDHVVDPEGGRLLVRGLTSAPTVRFIAMKDGYHVIPRDTGGPLLCAEVGTHVHIARKYNGEWVPADGPLAFNLEGWLVQNGYQAYEGNLVRFSRVVRACVCSDQASQIQAGNPR